MKSQYFADNRDLFKYDLIMQLIQEIDSIHDFIFIPMLTENDGTGHGGELNRRKAKAGIKNKDLVNFLDECVREDRRDIKQLKKFFKRKRIRMTIYKGGEYFVHKNRREYFELIGNKLLLKSLIFVDPDNGLEIQKVREKHIRYKEIQGLYNRMDKNSALMMFQFFPLFQTREACLREKSERLREEVGDSPIYVSDNQIAFFFLAKDKPIKKSIAGVIREYAECYRLHWGH